MGIILWVILGTFLLYYYVVFKNRCARVIYKTFPHALRLPIVNNLYLVLHTPKGLYQKCHEFIKDFNYKTFAFWTHEKAFVFTADYNIAKILLSSSTQLDKAFEYDSFKTWLGEGIFTAKGDKWKKNRKLLNPAFHFKILQNFFSTFNSNADVLCEKLEERAGKEAFDVYQYVTLYALDNICSTSMGVSINAQTKSESKYVKAVKKMSEIIFVRIYTPWLRPNWLFKYTPTGRLYQRHLDTINGHNGEIIRKKKKEFELNQLDGNNNINDTEGNIKKKIAFLDLLLEISKGGKFTDEEIRNEVATVMFGVRDIKKLGHDTMASAISFLLYALAEHQDVQAKVYQELMLIFGSSDRCPTYEDVQEMKYAEQVIKETLRVYTVLPAFGRHLTEDLQIGNGQFIPKDTEVLVVAMAIHRDPEIWDNPDVFDPERFSPEASKDRHPYAFIPFSAGVRNCIGQKFAMHQMKITLYKVLKKFKILPSDKPEDTLKVKAGVILTSIDGIKIKLQLRLGENDEQVN